MGSFNQTKTFRRPRWPSISYNVGSSRRFQTTPDTKLPKTHRNTDGQVNFGQHGSLFVVVFYYCVDFSCWDKQPEVRPSMSNVVQRMEYLMQVD